LDAVWLACIFLAIISTFSMPLIVWGSNVLYPLGYTQVHSSLDVNLEFINLKDGSTRKKGTRYGGNRLIQRTGEIENDEY
jgi:hypothetical protein